MALDTATLIALVATVFTLLGALISSVFGYYALKKQDDRRFRRAEEDQKKLALRRKIAAYRRLEGIREQVLGRRKVGETASSLTGAEYEAIQSTIAQEFDVLDDSTVATWDTRGMMAMREDGRHIWIMVLCEAFWPDIKKHYDAIKFSAVPHES